MMEQRGQLTQHMDSLLSEELVWIWPRKQQFVQALQSSGRGALTDLAVLRLDLLLSHIL